MDSWLPITEYAVRNRVSVSTIRRKIKNKELKHRLEGGKYFVLSEGEPLSQNPRSVSIDPTGNSVDEVLDFAERSIKEITKLNQEIITEKDSVIVNQKKKIQNLQEELSELKMLITLLEKNKA